MANICPSIAACCLSILLCASISCLSNGQSHAPQIFWSSNPVQPGETVLLGTTGPCVEIEARMISARNFTAVDHVKGSVTDGGLAFKFPNKWKAGALDVRVRGSSGTWSDIHQLNAPDPWFAFGDKGSVSVPGGFVRVVGVNMVYDGGAPVLTLTSSAGDVVHIEAYTNEDAKFPFLRPSRWHVAFPIPSTTDPGDYAASIHNGAASTELCTFLDENRTCEKFVSVRYPSPWPNEANRFVVRAPQPGYGRNATTAFEEAFAAAAASNGGVVYVPRGQYFVRGPLIIPEKTVLRGAGRELVAIYFEEDNATTAPPAYVTGSGTSFGVEGVSLYVTSYATNIVQFSTMTDGAFLRDSRIRYNSYFCLEPEEGKGSRGRNTFWSTAVGTAVKIAGTNVVVRNNDIYSSGDVVSTLQNGGAGTSYLLVQNNRFWNGGTTHWGISWKQAIYEGNVATGVSATSMGSNYPQYDHADGRPHVQNIYHANNSQNMVWGNDREMMTTDCCGGVYYGRVREESAEGTCVHLAGTMIYPQPGGALCVLNGTNAGDCRRVASGGNLTAVFLNKKFASPLDASSLVTIVPFQGHIAFVGNRYSDGGEVQLYGQALECVMADNSFTRTGGLSAWARSTDPAHGWGTNQRNQFLDNVVLEGNHVYNWDTKPNSAVDPKMEPYFPGGSKTIEPWFFGSLTNDQGLPVEASPVANFTDAFNRLIVFRGNRVNNNGGIVVRGTSANVLVENNVVSLSDVGVHVNYTTTKGGIVVENNTEPPGIPNNFNPYASGVLGR